MGPRLRSPSTAAHDSHHRCCCDTHRTDSRELRATHAAEQSRRRAIFNQLQEIRGNIRVFCRVRPSSSSTPDDEDCTAAASLSVISAYQIACSADASCESGAAGPNNRASARPGVYEFDQCFGPESSQADVFAEVAPLVTSVMDGYHGAILAYGQTGSGKTCCCTRNVGLQAQLYAYQRLG